MAALDLHHRIFSHEPMSAISHPLTFEASGSSGAQIPAVESSRRSSSQTHTRQFSSTSSSVSHTHTTEPLLGLSAAFEELLEQQPLHPSQQQGRDAGRPREMGLGFEDVVSEREWIDVWEGEVRRKLKRLRWTKVVLTGIIGERSFNISPALLVNLSLWAALSLYLNVRRVLRMPHWTNYVL